MKRFSQIFIYSIFVLFCFLSIESLRGQVKEADIAELELKDCLLPVNHEIYAQLKELFENPIMFESPQHLRNLGFHVIDRMNRGLMVFSHPSIKNYLFKKYINTVPQAKQLRNFIRRINGARRLSQFIQSNQFKHIVVPNKWIYRLPKKFSNPNGKRAYILIVEEIDVCCQDATPNQELIERYTHIDYEVLKELCYVVYYFRGLDSTLLNMPFTYQGKIAFIDTERWMQKRESLLSKVLPYLDQARQDYTLALFKEIQLQDQK